MPTLTCTPPTTLRFGSIPGLLGTLQGPAERGKRRLRVRIGRLRWIDALPLAVLAAYVNDHLRRNRGGGVITFPRRHEYLQRMDFFRTIGVELPERFERHEETGRFVPVREVTSGQEVHEVAAQIVETLRVGDTQAALVLRHCVGEVIDNVFVHASSPTNATVCAQHFPNALRTQVGIVDTGVGFLESFKACERFARLSLSDRDAITLGLAPFVTSKPDTSTAVYGSGYGRLGVGLFIVSSVLEQVGGRVLVASGDALFHRRKWFRVRTWQGAIVGFEVPDVPLVSYEEALRVARARATEIARRQGRG